MEKEFIPENIFRTEKMLVRGVPALKSTLIKELKQTKPTPFRKRLLEDSITSLKNIETRIDFDYLEAFTLIICFSEAFENLRKEIVSQNFDLHENFYREDYWRNETILYKDALYFSYPFLFESFRQEMSIDIKHLTEQTDKAVKNGNAALVAKIYISFMKKIKKKSEK